VRSIRRYFGLAMAATLLGAGLAAGSTGTAQAAASDCEGGANGFTDIPNSLSGRGVAGGGGLTVRNSAGQYSVASFGMQAGYVAGREMGWGYLQTSSTWAAGTTGSVWMDVTNNSGSSWIQCGPFWTSSSNTRLTTAAYPTSSSSSRQFRVCAHLMLGSADGGITCTNWW
jgi:hypothetical protein